MAKSPKVAKVSAGIHSNVNRKMVNALRSERKQSSERVLNQLKAFRQGKRVMVTIANPNKEETNKRFIRVNARDIWKNKEGFGFYQQ